MTRDGENWREKTQNRKRLKPKFRSLRKDSTIRKNVLYFIQELLEKELILDEITNLSEKLRKQAVSGR
jgi:hypothetical protein